MNSLLQHGFASQTVRVFYLYLRRYFDVVRVLLVEGGLCNNDLQCTRMSKTCDIYIVESIKLIVTAV